MEQKMKRLLNTLFVTTQGAYLARDGETVDVRVEHQTKLRVPIHTLGQIICFGQVGCSPFLMGLCGENNVLLSFLTENGRFLARVHGPVSGNVLLRKAQCNMMDIAEFAAGIARNIITAKIANCRAVVRRAIRDYGDNPKKSELEKVANYMNHSIGVVERTSDMEVLRGLEGEAARTYFSVFDDLIVAQKDEFAFRERSRRPPLDNVNALLSFIYTLLAHDVVSALEAVGLDPAMGFFHTLRSGRPSLALDLMEELRPVVADRLVLSMINRRQVQGGGFTKTESGAVVMDDETRKTVLASYQSRKKDELSHPFTGETVNIGLLPHVQAMLLARYIRGDIEGYPPFFWK